MRDVENVVGDVERVVDLVLGVRMGFDLGVVVMRGRR